MSPGDRPSAGRRRTTLNPMGIPDALRRLSGFLVLWAWAAAPAVAQGSFAARLGRGELGLQGQGSYQFVGPVSGSDVGYGQWLRLPVSGFLVHPRVLNYSLTLSPQFSQQDGSYLSDGTRNRTLGTDFSLGLFPTRRMSLTLQGTQTAGRTATSFGAESEVRATSLSMAAFFRHRYFPSTVSYQQRGFKDSWASPFAAAPVLRDQVHRQVRLEIRNKKLTSSFTRSTKDDHLGHDDFVASAAQLTHRAGWGKGSTLTSSFSTFSRSGFGPIQQRSVTERLHLQHTRSVSTGLLLASRAWGRGRDYTSKSRTASVVTSLRPSSSFEASVAGDLQRFTAGTGALGTSRAAISPSIVVSTTLPGGVRVSGHTAVGLERTERTGSDGQWMDVVDEQHRLGESWRIVLDRPRVDLSSIEVWAEDRTFRLEPELDYRVLAIGGFVEIQVLPSGRTEDSALLLVTYRYERFAVEAAASLYWNYDGSATWRTLTLRHGRRQRSEEIRGDGGGGPQANDLDTWLGVGFSGRTPLGPMRLELNRRTRSGSGIHTVVDELQGQVDLPFRNSVRMGLLGAVSRARSDGAVTESASLGGHFTWTLSRSVRVRGGLRGFQWAREGADDVERFMSGNGVLTWEWGQISTLLSYDQSRRWNGAARADHHWSLRVVRHF